MVSLYTTRFDILPTQRVYCFVWISEQTAIIYWHRINWLVFITDPESVHCAVRTGSLDKTDDESSLKFWKLILSQVLKNYLTYLLTYLLTPWSRVLLEKLTGSAASQEIPRIFGTRYFLTVPTSARHLSLSWANSIQSPQPPPTSWRSILTL